MDYIVQISEFNFKKGVECWSCYLRWKRGSLEEIKKAEWIKIRVESNGSYYRVPNAEYCSDHTPKKIPKITMKEILKIVEGLREEYSKKLEEERQRIQEEEQKILESGGFIQRLTCPKGWMFEDKDGYFCILREDLGEDKVDISAIPKHRVCCWHRGLKMLGHRSHPEHSPGCPGNPSR